MKITQRACVLLLILESTISISTEVSSSTAASLLTHMQIARLAFAEESFPFLALYSNCDVGLLERGEDNQSIKLCFSLPLRAFVTVPKSSTDCVEEELDSSIQN